MPDRPVLKIMAGPHARRNCLLRIPGAADGLPNWLRLGQYRIPVQHSPSGAGAILLPHATSNTMEQWLPDYSEPAPEMARAERQEQAVLLSIHGRILARYCFGPAAPRPYFWPLCAPDGAELTRAYPMEAARPGETHDHPHHRSLWIAHGEVNGSDNWSDSPGHARTAETRIQSLESGPVWCGFRCRSTWLTDGGEPLLGEALSVRLWVCGETTAILDLEIELTAEAHTATFGDTKEGGIVSVRVASALDASATGRIENSVGAVGEGECWGRRAHWCHYSGTLSSRPAGIGILDHPNSFRSPAWWHVRDYGLMTANVFGLAAFTEGRLRGEYPLPRGDKLWFGRRLVLYAGLDTPQMSACFLDYAAPPVCAWTAEKGG